MRSNLIVIMEQASKEYQKLPKWWRDRRERERAEMEAAWQQPPTCLHCGRETKRVCRECYPSD